MGTGASGRDVGGSGGATRPSASRCSWPGNAAVPANASPMTRRRRRSSSASATRRRSTRRLHGGAGGHPCPHPLRHRCGGAVRRRSGGGGGERGLGPGALGIDGAAHEGACGAGAPPVAVVAGGLDRPLPAPPRALVGAGRPRSGVIVSESPAGVPTEKWRFPVRNRLLAALSDVVVVVESRHHGGSRHTVEAAMDRGHPRRGGARIHPERRRRRAPTRSWLTGPSRSARPATSLSPSLSPAPRSRLPARREPPGATPARPPAAAGAGRRDAWSTRRSAPTPPPSTNLTRVTGLGLAELCGAPATARPGRPGPRQRGLVGAGLSSAGSGDGVDTGRWARRVVTLVDP